MKGGRFARLFIYLMDIVQNITQIIEPSLDAMGYAIVQVRLGEGKRKTLSVMAERKDERAMCFDDCSEISNTVSALLDVEDPIQSAYDLEVCSPGVDRPLTKAKDFARYVGHEAKIETMLPVDGRRRFRGVMKKMEGDAAVTVVVDGQEITIQLSNIRAAKLMMSETLVSGKLEKPEKKGK